MSEHLSAQTLERYRQKSLAPQELLAADDHLADCADCRESLMGSEALQAAFTTLRADLLSAGTDAPEHLSYKMLVAYVESAGYGVSGGMDSIDREIVESHLEICPECASEVRELRAFQTVVNSYPAENYAPRSRWEKWTTSWGSRRRLMSLTLGTALGAALVAVIFALHPWQRTPDPSNTLASSKPSARPSADAAPFEKGPALPAQTDPSSHQMAQTTPNKQASTDGNSQKSGTKPGVVPLPSGNSPDTHVAENAHGTPGTNGAQGPHIPVQNGDTPKIATNPPHPDENKRDAVSQGVTPSNGDVALTDAKSYVGRAGIRLANGKYDRAMADYKRATELDPNYAPAWEGLSWSEYLAGKYDDALADNAKALELSKNVIPLHFRRGLIYATKGEWETAQSEYEKTLDGAANSQKSAALKEAKEAQRTHPDIPALTNAVELLEKAGP